MAVLPNRNRRQGFRPNIPGQQSPTPSVTSGGILPQSPNPNVPTLPNLPGGGPSPGGGGVPLPGQTPQTTVGLMPGQGTPSNLPELPNFSTGGLDAKIKQMLSNLQNPGAFNFNYSPDPQYQALIDKLMGSVGSTQGRLNALLEQANAPSGNAALEAQLQETLSKLMSGDIDVGNIDVQGDPEAAAFRTARERQAQRERSALAERAAATGGLQTGGFDAAVGGLGSEAGRDIAGFEAGLARDLRNTMLQQRLQGAQLGLADVERENAIAEAARDRRLREAGLLQSGYSNDLGTLAGLLGQQEQAGLAARQQAFNEFTQGRGFQQQALENYLNERQAQQGLAQQMFQNRTGLAGLESDLLTAETGREATEAGTAKTELERQILEEQLREDRKRRQGSSGGIRFNPQSRFRLPRVGGF